MNIKLNYATLPNSMVTPAYMLGSGSSHNIDMRAPANFVRDAFFPIMKALAQGDSLKTRRYVYSSMNAIIQMEEGSTPIKCGMVYLRKSRAYADAFNLFSTYGINLTGVWLAFHDESKTLYVPKKIHQFVCRLAPSDRSEYVLSLIYYYRLLRALTKVDNSWQACSVNTEPTFQIDQATMAQIVGEIEPKCDFEEINLECLRDDMSFRSLVYVQTPKGSDFPLALGTPAMPDNAFYYNVLESGGKRFLAIVNKMFTPAALYIVDPSKSCVFTNVSLQMWNCTADGAEFIPYLAKASAAVLLKDAPVKAFAVANLPGAPLIDAIVKGDFEVQDDAAEFEDIVALFPKMSENGDPSAFSAECSKCKPIKGMLCGGFKDQYADDPYAQELYKKNLPHYETFQLGPISNLVKGVASSGPDQVYSMFFKGHTGTGKSTAARVIFCRAGLPWNSINCSTNIDEADIFGCMVPNPEKKTADDPEFVWKDGPATVCIRNGYGLIVEEANGARPGVLLKFNSLLDDARQVELGSGEVLTAHPNFRIVFTANIAYEGTNELNMALVDRFDAIVEFHDMPKQEAIDTIVKRTGYQDVSKIEKIYGVYEAIKKYSDENNLGIAISIRRLLCIFTKGKYFKTARDAVENMLLEHAFIRDEEHKEYFVNSVLPAFDLKFKI